MADDHTFRVVIAADGSGRVFQGRYLAARIDRFTMDGIRRRAGSLHAGIARELRLQAMMLECAANGVEGVFGLPPATLTDRRSATAAGPAVGPGAEGSGALVHVGEPTQPRRA